MSCDVGEVTESLENELCSRNSWRIIVKPRTTWGFCAREEEEVEEEEEGKKNIITRAFDNLKSLNKHVCLYFFFL